MPALLPPPVLQFADANGKPYAGGSLLSYIPGTTTPKTTWSEPSGTAANTNPIMLDAAGRCILYGDGVYRLILTDALGNLVFDQASTTLVSAAMAPVCIAPDIPTAVALLGVVTQASLVAVNAALAGAITTEATARTAAITAETTRALAAEAAAQTAAAAAQAAVTAETARALAAEAAIGASVAKLGAGGPTNAAGHVRVTFPVPFPTSCTGFFVQLNAPGLLSQMLSAVADRFGADVWSVWPDSSPGVGTMFSWVGYGN